MSQEEYLEFLRQGVVQHGGYRAYARVLGVDHRRLHEEITKPGRKYGKHEKNVVTEAVGLLRVQTISYVPIPGGPSDPAKRSKAKKGEPVAK